LAKYYKAIIVLLSLMTLPIILFTGCGHKSYLKITIHKEKLTLALKELVRHNPDYFETPFTFMVILDSKACGGNLVETNWWPEWQEHMENHNIGFIFVTSRTDSIDLDYAIQLENMEAPILVMPGYDKYVSDLWFHPSLTLKILYNIQHDDYHTLYGSILDSSASSDLLYYVDSILNVIRR